jgi:hypothetical protein
MNTYTVILIAKSTGNFVKFLNKHCYMYSAKMNIFNSVLNTEKLPWTNSLSVAEW